jgi:hypothetical protein
MNGQTDRQTDRWEHLCPKGQQVRRKSPWQLLLFRVFP